jgi:Flp pilus assembly protein TadG
MLQALAGPRRARRPLSDRRAMAAMEFALVAPVMGIIFIGALNICRAYIAWEEVNNAAEAVVQAAEKLAEDEAKNSTTGTPQLSYTDMQAAMSTIYVEMPGLDYGKGDGLLGQGAFAVTLSEVDYSPRCANTSGCAAQTPQTLWSSYLAEGGNYLDQINGTLSQVTSPTGQLYRSCGTLVASATFPNNQAQLLYMVSPMATPALFGPFTMTMAPQLVADVRFVFKPTPNPFIKSIVFWASSTLPAPIGGPSQEVAYNSSASPTSNVKYCGPIT